MPIPTAADAYAYSQDNSPRRNELMEAVILDKIQKAVVLGQTSCRIQGTIPPTLRQELATKGYRMVRANGMVRLSWAPA